MNESVVTFGCRLNAHEAEVIEELVRRAALHDAVVVNTCAVTAEAVRQSRQSIRRIARERPGTRIVVSGCAAQIDPQRFAAMPEVDHVIGNGEKLRADTFSQLAAGRLPRVAVGPMDAAQDDAGATHHAAPARTRAFVQVQNGCDHRCTFCVIPFGRGPSRSLPISDAVARVRALVEGGCKEVVLTGVDLTSYGADLPDAPRLGDLARRLLAEVPELPRLRLSSIDQVEVDEALLAALAEEPRLMPHLHLSMQAGDDLVLKRMKRRHSRAALVAFCERARRLRPDVVFGADIIAGFPTESDAMFENTLRAVDDCGLTYLHVFPYSAREGTPAARMPQVPAAAVKERAQRLRDKGEQALTAHLDAQVGRDVEILVERNGIGRTPQFAPFAAGKDPAPGTLRRARVRGHDGRRLTGEVMA